MNRHDVQWARARASGLRPSDAVVVVDIGGTRVKLGAVAHGRPLDPRREAPVAALRGGRPVDALSDLIESFAATAGIRPEGAIVTVPGFVDRDFDTVIRVLNVPELEGLRLATDLAQALGIPTVIERDTVLLLEGECEAGAALGLTDVAGIFVGTGIGAAYISDGEPFRGGGWAMELGHVPLGRRGTLEDVASGAALASLAQTYETPIAALFDNEDGLSPRAIWIVDHHANAVAGLMAILSPQTIVMGGGVVAMPNYPWGRVIDLARAQAPLPQSVLPLDLRQAELGWASALYGALRTMRRNLAPYAATVSGRVR